MLDLPTTFGKYYLTEKLAAGGMAEIYLGKIVGPGGFEKLLVIKQIHPRLSGQRHFVDLFVAEAKTLVTLAHGNIVPVYELGVVDDTYFIAMDYIDGPTLYRLTDALARRGATMEPVIAAWIAARVLEGLDYAHRKGEGVIHRDLSPRNVMLSRDGEVKLVDFGIAVTLGAAGDDDDEHTPPTGSFAYMSPEQVRKEPLTGQSDLFSVGVLMWEMLVGRRLFSRTEVPQILKAVVDDEIPAPSSQRPGIPAKLDDVVMKALQRDLSARWASASQMLAELQRFLYNLDQTPDPRDIASLVARHCPPEVRQTHTHSNPPTSMAAAGTGGPVTPAIGRAGPSTTPLGRPGASTTPIARAPLNATAPIVRPPAVAAHTVTRTGQREQSFATHIALKGILDRATQQPPSPPVEETTASSGEASSPPKRTFSPSVLAIAGVWAVVLALGGSIVYFRSSSPSDERPVATRLPPTPSDAMISTVVSDAQPPGDAADNVTITIESSPSGAAVYREADAAQIGTTPYAATVRRGANDLRFTVKRSGYAPKVVVVLPDRDRMQHVELSLAKRTPPSRPTASRPPTTPRPPTTAPVTQPPPDKRGDPGNPYQ
ncbi:MAG: protein kinase [Kofleriaceae bacterium]